MSSDLVYVLFIDNKDYLWVGTNQGVNKIDINEFKRNGKKLIKPYTKEEGFQGVECNGNGASQDPDGSIWFGTVNGLIKYSPSEDFPNALQPKTSLSSITISDRDTVLENNCKLPYRLNTLTFNFASACLSNPDKVHYRYKLEGIDANWSAPGTGNFVKYSSLPPGNYEFKVMGSNNENVWNTSPVSFSFTIIPP